MKNEKSKIKNGKRWIRLLTALCLLLTLLLLVLFSGCAKEVEQPAQEEVERSNKAAITSGNFKIELTTTKKQFKSTELIPLKLTLLNTSSSSQMVRFNSSQKYDFVVRGETGEEVWRWSKGRMFTQMIEDVELPSQGGRNFFEKIEGGTLKLGKYTISAMITASEFTNQVVEVKIEVK